MHERSVETNAELSERWYVRGRERDAATVLAERSKFHVAIEGRNERPPTIRLPRERNDERVAAHSNRSKNDAYFSSHPATRPRRTDPQTESLSVLLGRARQRSQPAAVADEKPLHLLEPTRHIDEILDEDPSALSAQLIDHTLGHHGAIVGVLSMSGKESKVLRVLGRTIAATMGWIGRRVAGRLKACGESRAGRPRETLRSGGTNKRDHVRPDLGERRQR